jgi:uncharacterized membrane protein YhaH (DUF805 family)
MKDVFAFLFSFKGRTNRTDFTKFILGFVFFLIFSVYILSNLGTSEEIFVFAIVPYIAICLTLFVSLLAVGTRRMHDHGKSGVWHLLFFFPLGYLFLLFLWFEEGEWGENKYGADPRVD